MGCSSKGACPSSGTLPSMPRLIGPPSCDALEGRACDAVGEDRRKQAVGHTKVYPRSSDPSPERSHLADNLLTMPVQTFAKRSDRVPDMLCETVRNVSVCCPGENVRFQSLPVILGLWAGCSPDPMSDDPTTDPGSDPNPITVPTDGETPIEPDPLTDFGPDGFALHIQLASDISPRAPTTVGIVRWALEEGVGSTMPSSASDRTPATGRSPPSTSMCPTSGPSCSV